MSSNVKLGDPVKDIRGLASLPVGTRIEDGDGDQAVKLEDGKWAAVAGTWAGDVWPAEFLELPAFVLGLPEGDPYMDLMRTFNFGDRVTVKAVEPGHFTLAKAGDIGTVRRLSRNMVFVEITWATHSRVGDLIPFKATEIEHIADVAAKIPGQRSPFDGLSADAAQDVPVGTLLRRVVGGFEVVDSQSVAEQCA